MRMEYNNTIHYELNHEKFLFSSRVIHTQWAKETTERDVSKDIERKIRNVTK